MRVGDKERLLELDRDIEILYDQLLACLSINPRDPKQVTHIEDEIEQLEDEEAGILWRRSEQAKAKTSKGLEEIAHEVRKRNDHRDLQAELLPSGDGTGDDGGGKRDPG